MAKEESESSHTKREDAPSRQQSVGSVAPDWVQLSTRTAPKRDRFEVFRENFSQHLYRAEVENSSKEGTFEGEIELLRAGSVGISRIVASPSTYARMRRHVSDSDDALTLFVGINHGLAIEQAGICHEFRPGNGFLYHGAIPGAAEASAPINLWGIKVPADRVTSSLAPRCGLKPTSVPTELPAMQLIAQYLNSFSTVAASPDTDIREAFGSHLVDLLMLIVGADRNSLELIKGRGLKAARTEGVLRAIARHFAAPNLTADGIGLDLGITGRQVHRLLEETTKTFYEHLLERRLIEAHKLLMSPACSSLNLAEIARRAGFTDRTHFHRVFRIRFGGTPMDVRAAAAREHAKRFGVVLPSLARV